MTKELYRSVFTQQRCPGRSDSVGPIHPKLAPTTLWKEQLHPLDLPKSGRAPIARNNRQVSRLWRHDVGLSWGACHLRRVVRHLVAKDAHQSLCALILVCSQALACGVDTVEGPIDYTSPRTQSLPTLSIDIATETREVGRDWIHDYDDEWDEEQEADDSPGDDVSIQEAVEALCGNGVRESDEECDLGPENGEWDEGRTLDSLCSLTCRNPVWIGDLTVGSVSSRDLEHIWVVDGSVHIGRDAPWGLQWRSLKAIHGDLVLDGGTSALHLDFTELGRVEGTVRLESESNSELLTFQAPSLRVVGGSFLADEHQRIEAIELDKLTHVGWDFIVTRCPSLGTLYLPALQRVERHFRISENDSLCDDLEAFQDLEWVTVHGEVELIPSPSCSEDASDN